MLDILEDYCEGRQYSYVRLDGNTNRVQRRLDCRRYNEDGSKIFIFLISTRAGGLGLNLATADTVILYDSDWNPQVDLQAMERAHRIGQVKPVRVYRLVCRGSVEERMVSRAEKKLFLNAMVAERSEDDNLVDGKEDESTALGIGGGTMSKGELASLIRFGANAIMDSNKGLDDTELDDLLEREGRDIHLIRAVEEATAAAAASNETLPVATASSTSIIAPASFGAASVSSSSAAAQAAAAAPKDSIEQMQKTLKDRLELLEEVDLRQLGDKMYNKKRVSLKEKEIIASASITDVLPHGATRERKQRIVMVDGSGSGYGNMVPVLQDNISDSEPDDEEAEEPKKANRGRAWSQMCYCTLCGLGQAKRKSEAANTLCNCAHCPRTFHLKCLHNAGITKGNTIFICPHHKCAACARSTAAAGGLLFRCVCCMTAFCEDCLSQDEVESLGRCRDFEEQCGYYSKQAYYIKCQSCLSEDNGENDDEEEPQVQELDSEGQPMTVKEGVSSGNGGSKNVSQAQDPVLPTQLMLVHWEHLVDEKDLEEEIRLAALAAAEEARRLREEAAARKAEEDAARKAAKAAKEAAAAAKKKKGTNGKRKVAPTAAAAPKSKKKAVVKAATPIPKTKPVVEVWPVKVPAGVLSFDTALNVVLKHPDTAALLQSGSTGKKGALDPAQALSLIRTKIDGGRYRSSSQFVSDVGAALASSKPMLAFFKRKVQLSLD
jgi:hypothetical protein